VTFYVFFWNDVWKSRQKVVSKSLVLSPSKWVHVLRLVITVIHFSYLFVHLRTFITFITHISKLLSFLWMWTLRPHFRAKMFDVVDLPVLTFGNCVLKTGVIKWPLKPHGLFKRFLTFFSESQNTDFLRFFELLRTFPRILRPVTSALCRDDNGSHFLTRDPRDPWLLTSHDSRLLQFPVRTTKWKCSRNQTSSLLHNIP